jgi:hypothetical protein
MPRFRRHHCPFVCGAYFLELHLFLANTLPHLASLPDIDKFIGTPRQPRLRACQRLESLNVYEPVCTHSNCLRKLRSNQETQAAGYLHGTQDQEGSAATLLRYGSR